jgi:hypothetical protein
LYNKTNLTTGSWKLGFINALNVSKKAWSYSGLQAAYKNERGDDFYLRTNGGNGYEKVNL